MSVAGKHIVQIVIKNTSTLDFTIPLFWHIKKHHANVKISILYCVFDKKEILRESSFFTDFCKEFGVKEYDFGNFLKQGRMPFKPVLKVSRLDRLTFFEIKEKLRLWQLEAFRDLFKLILYRVKRVILNNSIKFDSILPGLQPDIILFDNRNDTNFPGREAIFSYLYKEQLPTYLVPHAPHMRDAISEFCPFDEKGAELPDFCHFMIPFKYGTPWIGRENKKSQFFISGYPGLDSQWLQYCKNRKNPPREEARINVLFIIRRFLPCGVERTPDTDPFIIDYDEFIKPLRVLKKAMSQTLRDTHLIIKPHPANNYHELENVLQQEGFFSYEISHEPVYELLNKTDIACSLASTVLLVTAMANVPTIIFDTKLQRVIHSTWSKLEQLYSGMHFCLNNNDQFCDVFLEILHNLDKNYREEGIRRFFQDGSSNLIDQKINRNTVE